MSLHGGQNHTPKHCKGCDYREIGSGLSVCGYCSKTGKLRNCPVKNALTINREKRRRLLKNETGR